MLLRGMKSEMSVDVGSFYNALDRMQDAALEPELWKPLIEIISQACGALGVNIMQLSGHGAVGGVLYTDSLGDIMDAYFREEWNLRDHRAKFIPLMQRSGIVLESDFSTEQQLKTLEYYKFAAKYDTRHTAVVNFSSGSDQLFFVLQRRLADGSFDADDRQHLGALRSRLLDSAKLGALFSQGDMGGRLSAFERANVACVFFDRQGYVVASNSKADALLCGDVRISHRKIRALHPKETARFEAVLQNALSPPTTPQADQIVVPLTRTGRRPLLARIERVGANMRDIFARTCAMVLFEDLEETGSTSSMVLTRLFGLTPMECTIASLLSGGMDAQEAAKHCGIGYETARTHIRSILRKTGTERQAQLCSLLGRIRLG